MSRSYLTTRAGVLSTTWVLLGLRRSFMKQRIRRAWRPSLTRLLRLHMRKRTFLCSTLEYPWIVRQKKESMSCSSLANAMLTAYGVFDWGSWVFVAIMFWEVLSILSLLSGSAGLVVLWLMWWLLYWWLLSTCYDPRDREEGLDFLMSPSVFLPSLYFLQGSEIIWWRRPCRRCCHLFCDWLFCFDEGDRFFVLGD